ncbi:MAG: hypothetical protein WCF67_12420 [Chitinophagaceae bacterium]
METKRPLAPSFINRLDRYLLLNKPEIWSARTHMVLYYGFLFMALLAAIAFVVPDDPRTRTPSAAWVGFVSLVSLVGLIGWLIYLLRFNVFKRYGLTSPVNRLITLALYFVAAGTFILFCFVQPVVESIRANAAYTDQEIINDINTVNLAICTLEYDSLDHKWSREKVLVTDRAPDNDAVTATIDDYPDDTMPRRRSRMIEISPETLKVRLATEDSVQKINDSVYVFLRCPEYALLDTYGFKPDSIRPLSSLNIYRQLISHFKRPKDVQSIRAELSAIRKKYQWQENSIGYYTDRPSIIDRITERYGLRYISSSMHNILQRKHRWAWEEMDVPIRLFTYTALILSILLLAFRHTTAKTFFLSVLTVIILTVLTSLIVAFSGDEEKVILNAIIFYSFLSLAISLTAFAIKKRNVATGIAINLFLWLLPFLPLCIVARYYEELEDRPYYELDYAQKQMHLLFGEVVGLLLLIVLIGTFFHWAYRKWYAAPEN